MKTYTLPDGSEADVENPTDPQVQMWLQSKGAKPKEETSTTKDVLKSVLSGGIEGVARAPLLGGDLIKLAGVGINKVRPGTFSDEGLNRFGSQGWIDAFKGSPQDKGLQSVGVEAAYDPRTRAGEYGKAISSSIAGGATMGGLGALGGPLTAGRVGLTVPQLAINGGAGAAGQFGYDASRGFDKNKEGNPLVGAIAGALAGVGGQTVHQIFKPNMDQVLHNATKGMTPEQWLKSHGDLKDFKASGSQSYTLADLPELQSRVGGLARGLSNQTGGDLLQQKLSLETRMNTDIPRVMGRALEEASPGPVDPREIATAVGKAADAKLGGFEKQRTNALLGNLDNAGNVNPADLLAATNGTVRNALRQAGNQSKGTRYALNKAEEALLGRDAVSTPLIANVTPSVLNVRSLSKNVKDLNDMPVRDASNPKGAIRNSDRAQASKAAGEALKQASPGYRQAMNQYGDTTENLIKPLEATLVGSARNVGSFETLLTKLRQVPTDKLGQEISSLGLSDDQIRQLAKSVGKNLKPVPYLASADTQDRQIFQTLLDHVDPSLASQVGKKVSVADALARLSNEHSAATDVMLNLGKNATSNTVAPLSTISLRSRLRASEGQTSKISDLLGNPTPENLDKLRKLSLVDPRAKRALEWITTISGSMTASPVRDGE